MSKNSVKLSIDSFYDPKYTSAVFCIVGTSEKVINFLTTNSTPTIVTRLKLLKVTSVQIEKILEACPNLIELDLSTCHIETIPSKVFEMTHLKKLSLKNTRLSSVPEDLKKLKELEILDLSYNRINNIKPDDLANPNLKCIDLCGNAITTLNGACFESCTQLNLAFNPISEVDFYAPMLEELNMNQCMISSMINFSRFGQLNLLNLSSQQNLNIKMMTTMIELETLNIACNNLDISDETIQNILIQCPNLKNIDILYNSINISDYHGINILQDVDYIATF